MVVSYEARYDGSDSRLPKTMALFKIKLDEGRPKQALGKAIEKRTAEATPAALEEEAALEEIRRSTVQPLSRTSLVALRDVRDELSVWDQRGVVKTAIKELVLAGAWQVEYAERRRLLGGTKQVIVLVKGDRRAPGVVPLPEVSSMIAATRGKCARYG